ncbi:hypothetical protein M8J76_010059 [Diaphorina citri]|nr:hypothetical protein M8J76_010059 [Diaphorina citri]
MEEEIAKHILLFEKRMFGLTIDDVRKLAFDVAEKHGLSHQFIKEEKKAAKNISKRLSNGQLFPVPTSVQPGQQPSLNQQGQYHGLDRMINITPPQLGIPPLSIQTQGKHHQQQQGQLQVAGYFWFIMDSYPSYSFTWPEEYPEGRSRSHTQ